MKNILFFAILLALTTTLSASATINILLFNEENIVAAADGRIILDENSRIVTESSNKIMRIGKSAAVSWNGSAALFSGKPKPQKIQHIISDYKIQRNIEDDIIISPKNIADSLNIHFSQILDNDSLNNKNIKFSLFIYGYTENQERQICLFTFPSENAANNNDNNLMGKIEMILPYDQTGMTIKGETEVFTRLIYGYDNRLENLECLTEEIKDEINYTLPYYLLSTRDLIDFAVFIIETTIKMNRFNYKSNDGVGGDIDIAVITPHEGFRWIQLDGN